MRSMCSATTNSQQPKRWYLGKAANRAQASAGGSLPGARHCDEVAVDCSLLLKAGLATISSGTLRTMRGCTLLPSNPAS